MLESEGMRSIERFDPRDQTLSRSDTSLCAVTGSHSTRAAAARFSAENGGFWRRPSSPVSTFRSPGKGGGGSEAISAP